MTFDASLVDGQCTRLFGRAALAEIAIAKLGNTQLRPFALALRLRVLTSCYRSEFSACFLAGLFRRERSVPPQDELFKGPSSPAGEAIPNDLRLHAAGLHN
jgi:hypothetical protein